MIIVVFEFELNEGCQDRYFELAGQLKADLETQPGFISIERFESLNTPGRFVSLQAWQDNASVLAWRANVEHRLAQNEGRETLFKSYRLRVAEAIRDYTDKGPVSHDAGDGTGHGADGHGE